MIGKRQKDSGDMEKGRQTADEKREILIDKKKQRKTKRRRVRKKDRQASANGGRKIKTYRKIGIERVKEIK